MDALRARYSLERVLGSGAMGVVYLAHDLKHDRRVALKVLRGEFSASVSADRFAREIQLMARLQHPHVLPLFDSGEAAGVLYYIMPYVAGESLRNRLEREQQLSIDDSISIARAVADALSHAHAHNVIHRDIKPENILLSGGEPIVADFGIARAIEAGAMGTLTGTGIAIGTPAYMSPEQAAGDEIDGRSDVYGLGCVLYEMLAGVPPFQGGSAQMVLARHARDPVPSLRTVRPTVSPQLEAVIMKALAKVPADRYQNAGQLSDALAATGKVATADAVSAASPVRGYRRWTFAAVTVLVAILAGWWLLARKATDARMVGGVALLPCVNSARVPDSSDIGDRWTEEVIQKLVRVGGLQPKSWESVRRYKNSRLAERQIASELNAGTLARCRVSERPDGIQLSVQLIRGRDEEVIWFNEYKESPGVAGINAAQSNAARDIAKALGVSASPDALSGAARPLTQDPAALQFYRLGRRYLELRTLPLLRRSVAYFDSALTRDSSFARAYVGVSEAISVRGELDFQRTVEYYPAAARFLYKAIALDPAIAEAHSQVGSYLLEFEHEWKEAEAEHRKALALNPGSVETHVWYGYYLLTAERLKEAIAEFQRAVALDPTDALARGQLVRALAFDHQDERALREIREGIAINPEWKIFHHNLAFILARRGQKDSALAVLKSFHLDGLWDGWTYSLAGDRRPAQRNLDSLMAANKVRPVDPGRVALQYVSLGNKDEALRWLELAYAENSSNILFFLGPDPAFDSVRKEPRFQALRRRAGFTN